MAGVSEHGVKRLLADKAVVRGVLRWESRGGRVRTRVDVDNSEGETLRVEMHISPVVPWQYSIALLWNHECVRRLDVRGTHVNRCDGSNDKWAWETHKHAFRDDHGMTFAYTPDDIPATAGTAVADGEYRDVFEAFCREGNIDPDDCWTDPTIDESDPTLHEAEGYE